MGLASLTARCQTTSCIHSGSWSPLRSFVPPLWCCAASRLITTSWCLCVLQTLVTRLSCFREDIWSHIEVPAIL